MCTATVSGHIFDRINARRAIMTWTELAAARSFMFRCQRPHAKTTTNCVLLCIAGGKGRDYAIIDGRSRAPVGARARVP